MTSADADVTSVRVRDPHQLTDSTVRRTLATQLVDLDALGLADAALAILRRPAVLHVLRVSHPAHVALLVVAVVVDAIEFVRVRRQTDVSDQLVNVTESTLDSAAPVPRVRVAVRVIAALLDAVQNDARPLAAYFFCPRAQAICRDWIHLSTSLVGVIGYSSASRFHLPSGHSPNFSLNLYAAHPGL